MIKNNILADRLNKTRNGLEPETTKPEEFNKPLSSSVASDDIKEEFDISKYPKSVQVLYAIADLVSPLFMFTLRAFIFGFAYTIVQDATLPVYQIFAIGGGIELAMQNLKYIRKYN